MKILAIDPGNEYSAWCVLEEGRPVSYAKQPNVALLQRLRNGFECGADLLAVEMIASYGMAVGREVFETCLWIGRYLEAWESHGGPYQLVYRREVKLFHCQSVRATDANIRAALLDRYGPGKGRAVGKKSSPGPLFGVTGDVWSALAVGLTAMEALKPS